MNDLLPFWQKADIVVDLIERSGITTNPTVSIYAHDDGITINVGTPDAEARLLRVSETLPTVMYVPAGKDSFDAWDITFCGVKVTVIGTRLSEDMAACCPKGVAA